MGFSPAHSGSVWALLAPAHAAKFLALKMIGLGNFEFHRNFRSQNAWR
jgi:hypothetical protein